jgi:hypothetical protein
LLLFFLVALLFPYYLRMRISFFWIGVFLFMFP